MLARWCLVVFLLVLPLVAHAGTNAPVVPAFVLNTLPHDENAFTQGLFFCGGRLFETTGRHGQSVFYEINLSTGTAQGVVRLPAQYFGEGAACGGGEILWLTWRGGKVFRVDYEQGSLAPRFEYVGQGWGMTFDGQFWIMSNGGNKLVYRRSSDFAVERRLSVTDGGRPVSLLNELEWGRGYVFANVWNSTRIAVIDASSGFVVLWLELKGLVPKNAPVEAVANGIALSPDGRSMFVTGKMWPVLYEIQLPILP